jgi:uncharacterized protein with FMN-binding domain
MRRSVTAVVSAFALAAPAANAGVALTRAGKPKKPKKRVVTVKKTVAGDQGYAGRWGTVKVTLVVRKTTTIVGKRKTVKRKVVGLKVPVYPDHTNRSVFINQQALPLLEEEVLTAHYTASIDMISGATDTSGAFIDSLQSALLKVKTV